MKLVNEKKEKRSRNSTESQKHFKLQPTFSILPQNCHEHDNIMWQIGHSLSHIHSMTSVGYN